MSIVGAIKTLDSAAEREDWGLKPFHNIGMTANTRSTAMNKISLLSSLQAHLPEDAWLSAPDPTLRPRPERQSMRAQDYRKEVLPRAI
jgi:hypothetical protein